MQYAEFMCRIFDKWMHDLPENGGNWMVIDPIATIISNISSVFVTWCEYRKEKCDNFVCLYPDGELWLCDSFSHDSMREYAYLSNIFTANEDDLAKALSEPCSICSYERFYDDAMKKCSGCDIQKYCSGGCLPYRFELKRKSETLFSEYCEAKHKLINYIKEGVELALS